MILCQYYPQYDYDDGWDTMPDVNKNSNEKDNYLLMLKQTARLYSYTSEDIDELVTGGWALDEIEQLLFEYGKCIYRILGLLCCQKTMSEIHGWASSKRTSKLLHEKFGIKKISCYSHFTVLVADAFNCSVNELPFVLVEKFNLSRISVPEADLQKILG